MVDRAVKVDVELNLVNAEKLKQQTGDALGEARYNKSSDDVHTRTQMERMLELTNTMNNMFRGIYRSDGTPEGNSLAAGTQLLGKASGASDKIADDLMKIMKTGLGIIEDIHSRIKQASPLLQSVESLFNLAVQLFFMPLGNKLATVMIPAIIELVDNVMAMWDKIEGMDLGQMLNETIKTGAEIFGTYFKNLGEELAKQSGIAGSIGKVLVGLGDFIENHLGDLVEFVSKLLSWVMENIGTLINAFIEFKVLSLSLQTAQITATIGAAAGPLGAIIGGLVGFGVAEGVGHGIVASTGVYDATAKMSAAGSYVGATEGGRRVTVAEGGEGEFILPESRLQSMMDGISDRMVDVASARPKETTNKTKDPQVINNYFNITGYTDSQLKDIIRNTVNEQVSQSRLRSGF